MKWLRTFWHHISDNTTRRPVQATIYGDKPLSEQFMWRNLHVATFCEMAGRAKQEDALLNRPDKGVFMVCDGVGGAACGEVASQLVVDYFNDALQSCTNIGPDAATIAEWTKAVQFKFTAYCSVNSAAKGMATTMAMVSLRGNQAVCAHIGDSRIYHISVREQQCIWSSRDHSVVQELVDQGIISSQAERLAHPMRHRITRAIKARYTAADRVVPDCCIRNLADQDMLLICTDGVLEPFPDEAFAAILCNTELSLEGKLAAIQARCLAVSTDNCTCIVLQVCL